MKREEVESQVRLARDDPEAFGRLYDSTYPRIYGYVAKRIPNQCDAEDVTQQIFEKVLVRIDRFDPSRASFLTWLYKIANNAVMDYYRSEGDRCLQSLEDARNMYQVESPSDQEYVRKYIQLIGLLNRLNPSYQEILSLRLIEHMSNEEIAELLGYSNRYVAVKISRALRSLRKLAVKEGILEEFI